MRVAGWAVPLLATLIVACENAPAAATPSPTPSPSQASPTPSLEPSPSPVPTGPGARVGAAMGYDPVRKVVVMFGGAKDGIFPNGLDDTWLWDGDRWTEAHPEHRPGANPELFQMAFDTSQQVLLMIDGNLLWAWDGSDWQLRTTPHPQIITFGLAYDGDRNILFSQSTRGSHAWDGTVWHYSSKLPGDTFGRVGGALAWDPVHHQVVMFGGGPGGWGVTSPYSDTWLLTKNSAWIRATPAAHPHGTYFNQMFYADSLHKVLSYGGFDAIEGFSSTDVWAWDGADWRVIESTNAPPPLAEASAAWDAARHQLVLFGGNPNSSSDGATADTWTWDGTTWTKHTR